MDKQCDGISDDVNIRENAERLSYMDPATWKNFHLYTGSFTWILDSLCLHSMFMEL